MITFTPISVSPVEASVTVPTNVRLTGDLLCWISGTGNLSPASATASGGQAPNKPVQSNKAIAGLRFFLIEIKFIS